ncbi:synaptobrevin [Aspergillus piperis CBS 112811]|uniref:Synaptobrevin n=1 Tax=Aspergillus piperis CBS 112811 TaxID=1448313 RepID=A0A8G1VPX8_9EURO|nr:synaptobrevin [Aspergillus piperis CBS 112811]RAH61281.1 synaptobrevin [Aspergillus piperis CBS 112811]
MTLTAYSSYPDSPDLAALNLSRLVARLEHNLLSSSADLKPLRQSEYQRMRVGANIDYARTNLQTLERTLPQIKPTDRRNDLQSDLARQRQVLKQLQNVLDEISSSQAEPQSDDDEEEDDSLDGEDLLGTPDEGSTTDEQLEHEEKDRDIVPHDKEPTTTTTTTTASATNTPSAPPMTTEPPSQTAEATPAPTQEQPSTLRNRSHAPTTIPSTATASATGSSLQKNPPSPQQSSDSRLHATEETLSSHRAEQEDLTSSMLALATQLKTSAQTFHSSLEAEKSVLARAVDGIDRTAGNMKVAEQRMGMLRRMTEGKGWWGRMMLYAWIFGMWLVAILIVFLGPKLRF